jgi:hypothetical protein
MKKISEKDREDQFRFEIEAGREHTRNLEARLRERDAIIRLIVKGAEAFEEEARQRNDDVPF